MLVLDDPGGEPLDRILDRGDRPLALNGAAVITELKQRHPGIPVIAISGLFNSGHGMDADAAIALGAARALANPFKRSELVQTVTFSGRPADSRRCRDRRPSPAAGKYAERSPTAA
jgi:DNA-binding NtrC family response regulator